MPSGIYKIVNTATNKCYVGSAKNFDARWKRHFKDLRNGNHSSIKLQRSFDLHGESVFIPEILEELEYTKDLIIERENHWINKLNSKINGYNIADASFGDTISTHPNKKEIINKISTSLRKNNSHLSENERKIKFGTVNKLNGKTLEDVYGVVKAEKIRNRMSNGQMSRDQKGSKNPFYGKDHSIEFKKKLSSIHKGKDPGNRKPIIIDGIKYSCCREASDILGIKTVTIRGRCQNAKFQNYCFA